MPPAMTTLLLAMQPPVLRAQEEDLSGIPQEVLDRLPPDVVDQLRDGVLDKIPEDVLERLPASITDRIPDGFLESASANPMLVGILLIIGVLAVLGFFYGVAKSFFKMAIYSGIAGAIAWFWYFNIR